MYKCDRCGKEDKTVETVPSRSQLMFGGFPVKYEKRCQSCESILIEKLEKMLKNEKA